MEYPSPSKGFLLSRKLSNFAAQVANGRQADVRHSQLLGRTATVIVLVHNHPSGDPTPSRADIEMTKQIVSSAKSLGIVVHDHIIVGKQGHASFRGLGLI